MSRLVVVATFCGCLFTLGLFPSTAFSQVPHIVDVLYPQGGQRGTTVEVFVEGTYLQQPEAVLFYQPGIECTKIETHDSILDIQSGQRRKDDTGRSIKLTLKISKDADIGEYQLRVRCRDSLSEMVTFWVSPYEIVHEKNAWIDTAKTRNDRPEFAQRIPLNCTVSGYLPSRLPQDHDWYAVECERGQRLSVEVIAARLGTLHYGGMNDPAVRIYDADDKEIGRNDDNALHTQDPVLSVTIPKDGIYFIHMHQQMDYEAGRLRHYLMHVGTFPRPLVTYPLGGRAGSLLELALLGDARGTKRLQLPLPSDPGNFEAGYFKVYDQDRDVAKWGSSLSRNPIAPWPNRVRVARFGNILESGTHNTVDNPQLVRSVGVQDSQTTRSDLPIAINGRIESEGEVDWYRFRAKKGDRYRVRTYGKTLDSELDPRVWIRPAPGNNSRLNFDEDDSRWEPHDLVGHHYRHQVKQRLDPIFMFEPDTDGEWLIGIGDTRRESGPQHIYRVEFQPHVDSAFAHFSAYPSNPATVRDRIVLFPGHSYCRPVSIQAGFGSTYDKPLQLTARQLPEGVTIQSAPFKQDAGTIPVLFAASAKAKVTAEVVDLIVEPVDPQDRARFRGGFVQVLQATNRRGDYAMYFNRTRKMALAVVEGAAFNLEIESPKVPLVRNGELSLKVNVNRHPGFSGAVYCEMDWLPAGVNKQPPLIIPAGQNSAIYKLSARGDAVPGEYQISITGRENEGGNVRTSAGFHYVCSPFTSLTVGEPYVTIKLARAAIARGQVGLIQAEVNHHRPFTGEATLQLGRLPFGVRQVKPFPKIKEGDNKVSFQVEVTQDCLIAQYRDIFCEVTIKDGEQEIRQQTGNGVLRVDPSQRKD